MAHRISANRMAAQKCCEYEAYEVPAPGPGEALVRHAAIGLNYIDVYHRTGLYPAPCRSPRAWKARAWSRRSAPASPTSTRPARRLCRRRPSAPMPICGSCRPQCWCRCPDAISFDTAAAMMLKGMTAQYLLRQTYPVKPGDTILFHAAAGGVGPDRRPVGEASRRHGRSARSARPRRPSSPARTATTM